MVVQRLVAQPRQRSRGVPQRRERQLVDRNSAMARGTATASWSSSAARGDRSALSLGDQFVDDIVNLRAVVEHEAQDELVGGKCSKGQAECVDLSSEPTIIGHHQVGVLSQCERGDMSVLAIDAGQCRIVLLGDVVHVQGKRPCHGIDSSTKSIWIEAREVSDQASFYLHEDRWADRWLEEFGVEHGEQEIANEHRHQHVGVEHCDWLVHRPQSYSPSSSASVVISSSAARRFATTS